MIKTQAKALTTFYKDTINGILMSFALNITPQVFHD
jgi:hypothetical protein